MHDEAGEQKHLCPLFLVDKIFFLVRYHADTQLSNLEAANKQKVSDCSRKDVSKLLQRISSGSQLQRRGLSCRTVKLSFKSQLTKKKINWPIIVVLHVLSSTIVISLLGQRLQGLHTLLSRLVPVMVDTVDTASLHQWEHPPHPTQQIQACHHWNTQPNMRQNVTNISKENWPKAVREKRELLFYRTCSLGNFAKEYKLE